MLNHYKNVRSPEVLGEIDVYSFLDEVKKPKPERKEAVLKAREYYDNEEKSKYEALKKQLPCVTHNFTFNDWKNDKNIIAPTGLMYLDLDGTTGLDLNNPLIFASWISLSGNGRGILIKVEGLSLDNFKDTYKTISEELNIESDSYAGKATQFNVISYDSNIYINNDSSTYKAKQVIKNTPTLITYNTKKRKDATEKGVKYGLSYNSIDDIDFEGEDYLFFPDEKELVSKLYIPAVIEIGARNTILSSIAVMCRGLNPKQSFEDFHSFISRVNRSRCVEPLKESEIFSITKKLENSDLVEPPLNSARRIIFNPKKGLTAKEKRTISCRKIAKLRVKKTIEYLKQIVLSWDSKKHGKITQKKLAEVANKNIKTIEKYYKNFKPEIQAINSKINSS